ncbi:transcriptional regulator [Paraburkholderia madseniana]|uniref:transcriptional regulator n=1 Tax=Paraburkholderia madseniana TaxID=2599607 RepID=UPI0038BBBAE5
MKRNLFAELKEGMAELAAEREGKVTLRKADFKIPDVVQVSAEEIKTLREGLHASQAAMARRLRVHLTYLSELGARESKAECSGCCLDQAG